MSRMLKCNKCGMEIENPYHPAQKLERMLCLRGASGMGFGGAEGCGGVFIVK